MVKFLFAKEKTRVRFPLSAQGKAIYLFTMIKDKEICIGIVDHHSVVILSFAFFFSLNPKQKKKRIHY